MGAEWIYYGAIVLVVFPSAAFNRMAMVILLSWLAGQFAVLGGMHFELVNAIQHWVAGYIAFRLARGVPCLIIAAFFVPLATVDMLRLWDMMDPLEAWRWVLFLALAQAAIVPAGNNWQQVRATWRAYHSHRAIRRVLEKALPC